MSLINFSLEKKSQGLYKALQNFAEKVDNSLVNFLNFAEKVYKACELFKFCRKKCTGYIALCTLRFLAEKVTRPCELFKFCRKGLQGLYSLVNFAVLVRKSLQGLVKFQKLAT